MNNINGFNDMRTVFLTDTFDGNTANIDIDKSLKVTLKNIGIGTINVRGENSTDNGIELEPSETKEIESHPFFPFEGLLKLKFEDTANGSLQVIKTVIQDKSLHNGQ